MRFLKAYKIFESDNIDDYLKDTFMELKDKGLNLTILDKTSTIGQKIKMLIINSPGYDPNLFSYKPPSRDQVFTLEDVYYSIIHAKSYMEDEGYYISNIIGGMPNLNNITNINLSYFLSEYERGKGDTLDKNLVNIQLMFRKKN
jgi:hypothetical protein